MLLKEEKWNMFELVCSYLYTIHIFIQYAFKKMTRHFQIHLPFTFFWLSSTRCISRRIGHELAELVAEIHPLFVCPNPVLCVFAEIPQESCFKFIWTPTWGMSKLCLVHLQPIVLLNRLRICPVYARHWGFFYPMSMFETKKKWHHQLVLVVVYPSYPIYWSFHPHWWLPTTKKDLAGCTSRYKVTPLPRYT